MKNACVLNFDFAGAVIWACNELQGCRVGCKFKIRKNLEFDYPAEGPLVNTGTHAYTQI